MADSKELYQDIITRFHSLHRAMKQQGLEIHESLSDLTMLQLQALFCIKHQDRITMGELAQELHASAGALTALVDRLVKGGWVERIPDEQDRRTICLKLTADSKAKLKKIMDQRIEHLHSLFSKISQHDLEELARILTLLEESNTLSTTK